MRCQWPLALDGRVLSVQLWSVTVIMPGDSCGASREAFTTTPDMTPYFGSLYRLFRCSLPLNIRHKLVLDDPPSLIAFKERHLFLIVSYFFRSDH